MNLVCWSCSQATKSHFHAQAILVSMANWVPEMFEFFPQIYFRIICESFSHEINPLYGNCTTGAIHVPIWVQLTTRTSLLQVLASWQWANKPAKGGCVIIKVATALLHLLREAKGPCMVATMAMNM